MVAGKLASDAARRSRPATRSSTSAHSVIGAVTASSSPLMQAMISPNFPLCREASARAEVAVRGSRGQSADLVQHRLHVFASSPPRGTIWSFWVSREMRSYSCRSLRSPAAMWVEACVAFTKAAAQVCDGLRQLPDDPALATGVDSTELLVIQRVDGFI